MISRIDTFLGQYRFLSNFSVSPIASADGLTFRTAEHAYQAGKSDDPQTRRLIAAALTPGHAKRLGRQLDLPADWDTRRHEVMARVLRAKFSDPHLAELLMKTEGAELVEGNNWHDQYWGDCGCRRLSCEPIGENWLGRHLMAVRATLLAEKPL